MENNNARATEAWFVNKDFSGGNGYKSGPGAYDLASYKDKQSWNKGKVPFGSNSMLENGQFFNAASIKGVRNIPTNHQTNPGPGQYDVPVNQLGLQGRSPLRAAYQQMQKSRAQQNSVVNSMASIGVLNVNASRRTVDPRNPGHR